LTEEQVSGAFAIMGKCKNHPETEAGYFCMKHKQYHCDKCVKCEDGELYCKFRSSCVIFFVDKKGGKEIDS
jgi:hypothetical protein